MRWLFSPCWVFVVVWFTWNHHYRSGVVCVCEDWNCFGLSNTQKEETKRSQANEEINVWHLEMVRICLFHFRCEHERDVSQLIQFRSIYRMECVSFWLLPKVYSSNWLRFILHKYQIDMRASGSNKTINMQIFFCTSCPTVDRLMPISMIIWLIGYDARWRNWFCEDNSRSAWIVKPISDFYVFLSFDENLYNETQTPHPWARGLALEIWKFAECYS